VRVKEGLQVQLSRIPGITPKNLLERPYFFQCPPLSEVSYEYGYDHNDYQTVREGTFSRKSGRRLRAVTFATLVVDWGLFTLRSADEDMTIEEHTEALQELSESGDAFMLTMSHRFSGWSIGPNGRWSLTMAGPEAEFPVTLRSLRVTEREGEGDARYLDVSFTEYRDPVVGGKHKGKKKKRPERKGSLEFPVTGRLTTDGAFMWTTSDSGKNRATATLFYTAKNVTLAQLAQRFYGKPEYARRRKTFRIGASMSRS
jgi:hypothetical protein